jgi:alkanesulfonate monooxygenase
VAVQYPGPPEECNAVVQDGAAYGLRVGIIAREDEDEAWGIAYERFPEDRKGQLIHQLAMKVSDSVWHKQLSAKGNSPTGQRNTYWLGPFQNYKTFCPYLVGSYAQVAGELACYLKAGYRTYILDIPCSEEELHHISIVFRRASEGLQG